MRLGSGHTAVRVEDVTFWCNLTWGALKRIKGEMDGITEEDAQLEFLTETMADVVKRAEGLDDAEGKPVATLTPQMVEELPAAMVSEFFRLLFATGSALTPGEGPAPVPLASEAPSEK